MLASPLSALQTARKHTRAWLKAQNTLHSRFHHCPKNSKCLSVESQGDWTGVIICHHYYYSALISGASSIQRTITTGDETLNLLHEEMSSCIKSWHHDFTFQHHHKAKMCNQLFYSKDCHLVENLSHHKAIMRELTAHVTGCFNCLLQELALCFILQFKR